MKNIDILKKIGLNKTESAVYLSLVEMGPSTVFKISKKASIHRPLIYKALPNLEERKLVTSFLKGKHTFYNAEPPSKLEEIFNDLRNDFFEMLPELEDQYSTRNLKPIIRFLEGKEGIKNVYLDIVTILNKGDSFYRYSSAKDLKKAKSYLPKNYEKMRDNKKIERKVIMAESKADLKIKKLDRFVKSISEDVTPFDFNVTKIIYGHKIAYIDYNTETVSILENKLIADFEKSIFENLYKKL